jgi:hypothetical protein
VSILVVTFGAAARAALDLIPAVLESGVSCERDRRFESNFLRRGVCLTSAFRGCRRKDPAFAGTVSLDDVN